MKVTICWHLVKALDHPVITRIHNSEKLNYKYLLLFEVLLMFTKTYEWFSYRKTENISTNSIFPEASFALHCFCFTTEMEDTFD